MTHLVLSFSSFPVSLVRLRQGALCLESETSQSPILSATVVRASAHPGHLHPAQPSADASSASVAGHSVCSSQRICELVMASNSPNLPTAKNLNSSPTVSPSPSQGPSSGIDSSQRRSGGSGSFGAGATSRSSGGAPRHKQASRNQHKHSRRYRLADEDAIAESVSTWTSLFHLLSGCLSRALTSSARISDVILARLLLSLVLPHTISGLTIDSNDRNRRP